MKINDQSFVEIKLMIQFNYYCSNVEFSSVHCSLLFGRLELIVQGITFVNMYNLHEEVRQRYAS